MANWNSDISQSTLDVKSGINSAITNRESNRTLSQGVSNTTSYYNGSVVGINIAAVSGMRQAISEWVEKLKLHLDGIGKNANTANAYKSNDGEVEKAVQLYIDNCKKYCQNLMSDLLVFSDKLEEVKNTWIANTGTLSGVITSDAQTIDTGSAYSEINGGGSGTSGGAGARAGVHTNMKL